MYVLIFIILIKFDKLKKTKYRCDVHLNFQDEIFSWNLNHLFSSIKFEEDWPYGSIYPQCSIFPKFNKRLWKVRFFFKMWTNSWQCVQNYKYCKILCPVYDNGLRLFRMPIPIAVGNNKASIISHFHHTWLLC